MQDVLLCTDREELSTKETEFFCFVLFCFCEGLRHSNAKDDSTCHRCNVRSSERGLLILDVKFPFIFPVDF